MNHPPFPKKLQIQTTTACGAACLVCPHSAESKAWPNGPMDDDLFDAIVEQLRGQEVDHVSPYLMADPLSDKKIFDRIRQLRSALPNSTIELSTTGRHLVPAVAEKLVNAPLGELRISSHGLSAEEYARTMPGVDHAKAMTHIRRFIQLWRGPRPYDLYIVSMWGLWPREREDQIEAYWNDLGVKVCKWRVVSRAEHIDLSAFSDGSADPTPWRTAKQAPPYVCRYHRDTEWMHILSDGRVTLCCMDYGQQVILGDVRQDTIEEIWTSTAFAEIRATIRGEAPSDGVSLCDRCEWHVSRAVYDELNRRGAAPKEITPRTG